MASASTTDVTHKTALITGAARRIGRAVAEGLAADGWKVAIHYSGSDADADALVAALGRGRAVAIAADFADPATPAAVMDAAVAALGPVGCLINNASVFERDDLATATLESWDRHMAINLRAPFFLSQAFAAQVAAPAHGAIINILDERVWHLTPHFASYTLSKAGLWTFTQTAAMALAPRIRVNGIGPGPTLPSPRQTQAQFDAVARTIPLQRPTDPSEIAGAVRFILAAKAMTGQMIALDGGQHLGWGQVQAGTDPGE
ncbi:MAG: SDR family oxidoreductase [Rhodospirillaceae bacterium]|nr:SDR family oxidoreductase [Rhodospirillaceae bacterium]